MSDKKQIPSACGTSGCAFFFCLFWIVAIIFYLLN